MVIYLLGVILLLEAALLSLPLVTALAFGESILPILFTVLIICVIAVPMVLQRPTDRRIYTKEGFVTVAVAWILMSALGALPFVFSGAIPNYIDALFETVSGFTTTGATVLGSIEGLPYSILFWRSFTHWIGGMGVLVFVLAIMPSAGGQSIYLMRAEVPGPTKDKLVPKMRESALILYSIYIILTLVEIILLKIVGLPFYDAIVNAFSTAGTGGFSVLNDSIAGYGNVAAEWIIAIFMLIFGVNFNLYFLIIMGNIRNALRSEELRAYLCVVTASVILVAINTARLFENFYDCIRASFFQVSSIITTTGFVTEEFGAWPTFSKTVILLLMFIGACAGSTAGGLKISRVILLVKSAFKEIKSVIRPNSVNVVRLDGVSVESETARGAGAYFTIYASIIAITTLLLSFDGYGMETCFTAAVSLVNNVGPVLGEIGAFGNLAEFSYFSKIVMSLNMLIGRLEIMPMLVLFSPSTFRKI